MEDYIASEDTQNSEKISADDVKLLLECYRENPILWNRRAWKESFNLHVEFYLNLCSNGCS